jgi:DNA-binding GntR family transcriptional regulator
MAPTARRTPGTPASEQSLSVAAVVERVEEDIVLGRLHPRERLIEDDLMERFHAKRHVIRRALLDLERIGVVERVPNRGAQVRSYTAKAVKQLYEVRTLLETAAAALIPMPLPPAALTELMEIQSKHEEAVRKGDLRMVSRHNIAFHRALFANCGNPYLTATINEYSHRAHVIRFHSLSEPRSLLRARNEHRSMIAAIKARNRKALIELCREHLIPARDAYLKRLPPE